MPTLCITCDYDLQGLPDTALCPECATPVARSTADRRLRNADYHWLKRTTHGINWLERCIRFPVISILTVLVVGLAVGIIALFTSAFGFQVNPFGVLLAIGALAMLLVLAVCAVAYIPAVFYATYIPAHVSSPIAQWRAALRATSWSPIALVAVAFWGQNILSLYPSLPYWSIDALQSIVVLAYAVHDASLRQSLLILARRTDNFHPRRRKLHRPAIRHAVIITAILLTIIWLPYATTIAPMAAGLGQLDILAILFTIAFLHSPLKDTARALKEELRAASPQISPKPDNPPPVS